MAEFHEMRLFMRGPTGRLATILTWPEEQDAERGVIIASPNPLLGGDMENNVTEALAHGAASIGLAALRFDYRNSGRSDDNLNGVPRFEWWNERDELRDYEAPLADAASALRASEAWFRPIALLGYSFGGWVASTLAGGEGPTRVAALCPPLDRHDFSALDDPAIESLFVVSLADDVVPPPPAAELAARYPRTRIVTLDGADHFLLGAERLAVAPVLEFLR